MMRMSVVLVAVWLSFAAWGQKLSIQERLQQLEAQQGNQQNVADLVIQVQQLQQQIATLQGRLEEQSHQLNELQKRQKVLYVDMDTRLNKLEQGGVAGTATEVTGDRPVTQTMQEPEVREPINAEVSTSSLGTPSVSASETPAGNAEAEALYDAAFNHLKSGRYAESARMFEDFTQKFPSHDLTDNAYYWLGESYYVTRNYPLALSAFQSVESQFPLSSKLSDSLLKIGYTYHELEDYVQAQAALRKVVDSFPGTSVARLAENRLSLLRREGKIN